MLNALSISAVSGRALSPEVAGSAHTKTACEDPKTQACGNDRDPQQHAVAARCSGVDSCRAAADR